MIANKTKVTIRDIMPLELNASVTPINGRTPTLDATAQNTCAASTKQANIPSSLT